MDVIEGLIADHNRFRGIFARFHDAKEADDTAAMGELAGILAEELEVHTAAEEASFYEPAGHLGDEISAMVAEGCEEHHVADVLLEELSGMEAGTEQWIAKVGVLIESVEHHIDEEESDLFPGVRSCTDADQRRAMGERFEAERAAQGAPVQADAMDLTVRELREKAKEQKVPGRSTMDHDELAATIDPR